MLARLFFYVVYFLSPALPICAVYFSNPEKYHNPYFAASLLLGATAYTWLVIELILGARPKWIEKYFVVLPSDEFVLTNPTESIIDKGGYIYFAKVDNEIVGTFAMIKVDEYIYEIAKMAVTD